MEKEAKRQVSNVHIAVPYRTDISFH